MEEQFVERGIRCRFVNSQFDTGNTDGCHPLLHLYATLDERGAKMYGGQIRGGQEGLYFRGMVCGKLRHSGYYEVGPV